MISPEKFVTALKKSGITFISGVPDSLLKDACQCISETYGPQQHITATNEGSAFAMAIGHYLATGKPGFVYMQNSGLGNIVNPLCSLANQKVYAIPMVLMIGWRGEMCKDGSQIKDEPQHTKQGMVTLSQLELLDIPYTVLSGDEDVFSLLDKNVKKSLEIQGPVALVIRKNTFSKFKSADYQETDSLLTREKVIEILIESIPENAPVVSTTGKTSRELFELRKSHKSGHFKDFLTVGGMGHASQIATGIALALPNNPVYCIDGDGAVLMHMGGLFVSGKQPNIKHIVINNGSHDSVGGQPTLALEKNLSEIAKDCGYGFVRKAVTTEEIKQGIKDLNDSIESGFLEIKCKRGARKDLGRPDRTPKQNKIDFMSFLKQLK
ncbi:MAG: phosphonopyruvate decarboxylase [Bacteroidota bacterium]